MWWFGITSFTLLDSVIIILQNKLSCETIEDAKEEDNHRLHDKNSGTESNGRMQIRSGNNQRFGTGIDLDREH